jgi:hypothetical protein
MKYAYVDGSRSDMIHSLDLVKSYKLIFTDSKYVLNSQRLSDRKIAFTKT